MAKTAVKRSLEEGPSEKSKKQKYNTRDNFGSADQGEALSSDVLFVEEQRAPKYVKKNRPKSRKSAPIRRYDEEDEEDEGRMESQQFLQLVELEARKKKTFAKSAKDFTERFNTSIQSEERGLKKRVNKLETAREIQDTEFMDNFTRAFKASRPTPPPQGELGQGKPPVSDLYFSTLYKRSKNLTATARSIIGQFGNATEKTAKLELAVGAVDRRWEAENGTVAELVAIGRTIGVKRAQAMLLGDEAPTVEEDERQFVQALFGDDGEAEGVVSWGKLMKRQLRAGKKLYKTTLVGEVGV